MVPGSYNRAVSDTSTPARPIAALPPLLVNQIAAGEVVERPASVVKELVENALDAGASRVRLDLERGGIELVRVSDDGHGVPSAQAALMLAAHATSKIASVDDLDAIATRGFRGEALASIRSVSRMVVTSRAEGEAEGWSVECAGDDVSERRPASAPVGTTLSVRNLFFNTPARRKFLRTPQTEQTRCLDTLKDLAIAHPHVAFAAFVDGRQVLDLAPADNPRDRALDVLGRELDGRLLTATADEFDDARGVALFALVGTPELARASAARAQRLFVNGRPVRDRTVQHALREAYRGLIEPSRHPTAVVLLEMSPAGVDVNVHPQKSEVRFRDSGLVHSVVRRAVREALSRVDLTPDMERLAPSQAPLGDGFANAAKGFLDRFSGDRREESQERFELEKLRDEIDERLGGDRAGARSGGWGAGFEVATPSAAPRPADRVLQVHNSFLVTQDADGVVIIDQHALHERVMFERLRETMEKGPLESQAMLTPTVVEAPESQVDMLERLGPTLERLGIDAAPMSPTSIAIHAFPTLLHSRGVEAGSFLAELLETCEAEGFPADAEEAVRDVLDMKACKAAVKAGDRLSDEELAELLTLRERVDRSSNCPHGRPTSIRLSIRELERRFGR